MRSPRRPASGYAGRVTAAPEDAISKTSSAVVTSAATRGGLSGTERSLCARRHLHMPLHDSGPDSAFGAKLGQEPGDTL